ncbi:pyocin activator PrtN family protein [uncultured Albimonas sp.]|uniref:pyocin activator PrtN family protein n=1 Tax=uncultured Albimonas sp. TaxID=1331701 RepID=UPI0030ED94B9|tara:strand:+ start:4771 stop:5271 length:501 start_codon:yes stop_codon:yes gene_type:complete
MAFIRLHVLLPALKHRRHLLPATEEQTGMNPFAMLWTGFGGMPAVSLDQAPSAFNLTPEPPVRKIDAGDLTLPCLRLENSQTAVLLVAFSDLTELAVAKPHDAILGRTGPWRIVPWRSAPAGVPAMLEGPKNRRTPAFVRSPDKDRRTQRLSSERPPLPLGSEPVL